MTKRYVTMEVAKGQWVEWSIDPWDDTPDGYVSVIENDKEYWEIVRPKKPSTGPQWRSRKVRNTEQIGLVCKQNSHVRLLQNGR